MTRHKHLSQSTYDNFREAKAHEIMTNNRIESLKAILEKKMNWIKENNISEDTKSDEAKVAIMQVKALEKLIEKYIKKTEWLSEIISSF